MKRILLVTFLAGCAATPEDPSVESGLADDCAAGAMTASITACLDDAGAPRSCLARALPLTSGRAACDRDHDGMADDLEDAMARAYGIVLAFNAGGSGNGNAETAWPDNVAHYVASSELVWRVDSDESTRQKVLAAPTLDTLAGATIEIDGVPRSADHADAAANLWLCLKQPGGKYPSEALVPTLDAARTLAGGIDVMAVVHPANGRGAEDRYALVINYPYYAYNWLAYLDNHEGDWEGVGVLVNLDSGAVEAAYFERHPTADKVQLIAAGSPIDPARERSFGNVCNDGDAERARGIRFWDFAGARHHVIDYVSTGGHAGYGYPGNTKITGATCGPPLGVRDTHNGDGPKLLTWQSVFVDDWAGSNPRPVLGQVSYRNIGEARSPRLPWSSYRGQWGCQNGTIGKSWPGPWGNGRHCRSWVTHAWGAAPPFTEPTSSDCSSAP
jgi:hypothetical protein